MTPIQIKPRSKTAFVFAGGGSFGAIQVGMLKALAARGITADFVVGSSVGAMNAASYAGRPTLEGVRALEKAWRGIKRSDVFPISWRSLWGFARNGDVLVGSEGLRRICQQNLTYQDLADAPLPVHVVATDVLSGEPVILSQGSAVEAIVASAAIPAAFEPVRFNSRYLADGGISSNTPIKAAVALGARRVIVLSTGHPGLLDKPPSGALAAALHALTLILARQIHTEMHGLDPRIACFLVPAPSPIRGSPYDFTQTNELIDRATETADVWLTNGGLTEPGKTKLPRRERVPLGPQFACDAA